MAFKTFVESHLDWYKLVLVVSYEGEFTKNPDDIIVNLLKRGRIDQDGFDGKYDSMGVGCACNSVTGMEQKKKQVENEKSVQWNNDTNGHVVFYLRTAPWNGQIPW